MLDPQEAPGTELAATYDQRWEVELTFDELKTHQRRPRTVLRSKSPEPVLQEIWGHLCCHYSIRTLIADATQHSGHDPDRISFVAALRITRQSIAPRGAFPPDDSKASKRLRQHAISRLVHRLNPKRRLRAAPRVIKRKMSKWHVKRRHHANWPQPQHLPNYTILGNQLNGIVGLTRLAEPGASPGLLQGASQERTASTETRLVSRDPILVSSLHGAASVVLWVWG